MPPRARKRQSRDFSHPAQPGYAAAPTHTHEHCFRLVIERVRGEDMVGLGRAGGSGKEPVARRARRLLQSCPRFLAAPARNAVWHSESSREAPHRLRLVR